MFLYLLFKHYIQRARLKHIGKEEQLEAMNRYALRLAKGVALQTGTLMAATICNTSLFIPNNFDSKEAVKAIFRVSNFFSIGFAFDVIATHAQIIIIAIFLEIHSTRV